MMKNSLIVHLVLAFGLISTILPISPTTVISHDSIKINNHGAS